MVKHWCINQDIHHFYQIKKKIMINSIGTATLFDKIQHPFSIKTFEKLGIEGIILNLIKGV